MDRPGGGRWLLARDADAWEAVTVSDRCPTCGSARMTWTRDAMFEAIHAWVTEHGSIPSSKQWKNGTPDHPSQSSVFKVFGTWNKFVVAAGYKTFEQNWDANLEESRKHVLELIYRFRYEHGRLPRYRDFAKRDPEQGRPSTRTIERLFGSWNGALVAAGYEPTFTSRSKVSYRGSMATVTREKAVQRDR